MNKSYKYAVILSMLSSLAYAVTPSRLADGKVEFARWLVGDAYVYSDLERDLTLTRVGYVGALVTAVPAPSAYELFLSTCSLKFVNYSDFKGCSESTTTLQDKIDDLKPSEQRIRAVEIKAMKDAIVEKLK